MPKDMLLLDNIIHEKGQLFEISWTTMPGQFWQLFPFLVETAEIVPTARGRRGSEGEVAKGNKVTQTL